MSYKICKIDILENVCDLNDINFEIEILIINKLDLRNATKFDYGNELINCFKGVQLPIMLKHLFIKNIKVYDILIEDKENFLINLFSNLKLPFNCKIDALHSFKDGFDRYVIFYSSIDINDNKIYTVEKNNFDLLNRTHIFYEKLKIFDEEK